MFKIKFYLYPDRYDVPFNDQNHNLFFYEDGTEFSIQFFNDYFPFEFSVKKLKEIVEEHYIAKMDEKYIDEEGYFNFPIKLIEEELFYLSLKSPKISELISKGSIYHED